MKKILNDPNQVVDELIEGYLQAYPRYYERVPGVKGLTVKNKKDKVAILTGGGSGHEPLFIGLVGEGIADGVAIGNVFAAPTPDTVYEVTKAIDAGKGVLYIYGNYAGDVLNFDMGAELADMEDIRTRTVRVWDDVASAPLERIEDRRGIAGDVFVIKIAGAASEAGLNLDEVTRVTEKARDNTRSIGVALSPGSIPASGKPTFMLPEDEIEFGMGLHGEPGVKRTKMVKADELTDTMLENIFKDFEYKKGDEVVVLVNGLGSTTMMEMFIVSRRVAQVLEQKGISIYDTDVNSYCTCQEMAGVSITIMKLDDELKKYYNYPAFSPYYLKKRLED